MRTVHDKPSKRENTQFECRSVSEEGGDCTPSSKLEDCAIPGRRVPHNSCMERAGDLHHNSLPQHVSMLGMNAKLG